MKLPKLSVLSCLFLVLSIAGCGGISQPTDDMTLKVVQNSGATGYFPLYIAEQESHFKAQGLTLEPYPPPQLGTGPKVTAAMESDNAELAASTITDAITESRIDAHIRLVGLLSTDLSADLIASKKFIQQTHLTESSPTPEIIKALLHKKIGITSVGSATNAYVTYLFRQQGYDAARDATLVSIGASNTAAGLAALSNGRVDALAFPIPAGQIAESQGIGTMLIRSDSARNDVKDLAGTATTILYLKQQVADSKPKAVHAFIRAIAQAEAWIHKNPTQALALLAKYLKQDPKIVNKFIAPVVLPSIPQNPQISEQSYNAAMKFHVDGGLIAISLQYNDLVSANVIKESLQ